MVVFYTFDNERGIYNDGLLIDYSDLTGWKKNLKIPEYGWKTSDVNNDFYKNMPNTIASIVGDGDLNYDIYNLERSRLIHFSERCYDLLDENSKMSFYKSKLILIDRNGDQIRDDLVCLRPKKLYYIVDRENSTYHEYIGFNGENSYNFRNEKRIEGVENLVLKYSEVPEVSIFCSDDFDVPRWFLIDGLKESMDRNSMLISPLLRTASAKFKHVNRSKPKPKLP